MGLPKQKIIFLVFWCSPCTKWKRLVSFTTTLTPRKACPITSDQNASRASELVWAVRRIKKGLPIPGIESRFFARPSRSPVSVQTNQKLLGTEINDDETGRT